MAQLETVKIALRNPDFTTASRMAQAVNQAFKAPLARQLDSSTVLITVPPRHPGGPVGLMTAIEQLRVATDQVARVVIDEKSGVIVMGENVRISTVAIAQGNLTIRITETPQVSQPAPFSESGATVAVDRTQVQVDEDGDKRLAVLPAGISLQELVNGLNALGVGPRDMITILQAIKASGALQAEIEVM
jgi:flagellar P-ring protein precursor FlgI